MATKNNPLPVRPDDNFGQQGKIGQARQPQAQTPNAPDDVTSQPQTPAPVVGSTNSDGETIQNEEGDFSIRDNKNLWSRALQNVDDTAIQGVINDVQQSSGRPTRALSMHDPLANLNQKVAGQVEANQAAQEKAQKEAEEKEAERLSIRDMKEALEKQYHIESDAERAAREKNERRAKLFASIGDGISALSDLYFSTQGAPMVHDPASGMSERLRQRYEKLDAERKANEAAYQREYLRQLEQMRRDKKDAAAAALEAEYRRSQIDANKALAEQRGMQAHNSTTRTDAYVDSVKNRNANNTRRTDAFVSRTENQNQNNNARTQLAAQRAANSGRGGRSTGSGTRRRTGRGNTSGTQTRNNGGLGTNPRGL